MKAPTDEQLVADYLRGDPGSFELLVRRFARELHQFAMRFTSNAVAAEDVVQETFLQVHTSADKFDPKRRFKPWLFTIAANKARDALRRRNRRRELPIDAYVDEDGDAGRRFLDLFSQEPTQPDSGLRVDEKRRLVRMAVEQIPDRLREVLILAYYHRFAYKEIAEILGIPLGTVKSRLHSAVLHFADSYDAVVQQAAEQRAGEQRAADDGPSGLKEP